MRNYLQYVYENYESITMLTDEAGLTMSLFTMRDPRRGLAPA